LYRGKICAETHVVGDTKVSMDGLEFFRSDHFGLLAYVDVCDAWR
jgi:hypothetical protein